MKRSLYHRFFPFLMVVAMVFSCTACSKSHDSALTPVTLNEVAHSIFYAPMYVAIENGYFKDEGIDLTLHTGFGADKTMTALVSNEADIGFMGTESSIYAYIQGSKDYAVNFAQLTQRAGNFLVARKPIDHFSWDMLKNSTVLGGRAGGTPEMIFEYILKQHNMNPKTDLSINQSIDFGATAAAFSGGQGDYTIEFEPSATALESSGTGYVVASLGVDSGYLPYTAFCAKKSYMEKHSDTIQHFTNALQHGMAYTNSHSPAEIAKVIIHQFPDTDIDTLTTIVARYYDQQTWKGNLILSKKDYDLMLDVLNEAGVLDGTAPYEKLVNTDYATKADK